MRRTHHLKLHINFADAVLAGEKSFEIRYNDRGYQKGDLVTFETVDRMDRRVPHPVMGAVFEITYLLHGWGLKDGWCVFGIRRLPEGES